MFESPKFYIIPSYKCIKRHQLHNATPEII